MAGDETKTKHLVRGSLILGVLALRNGCRGRNLQVPCSKCVPWAPQQVEEIPLEGPDSPTPRSVAHPLESRQLDGGACLHQRGRFCCKCSETRMRAGSQLGV